MARDISVQDFVAIQNLVGKYQWLVDGGDSEGWAALWTEDVAFSGATTEPFVGREALNNRLPSSAHAPPPINAVIIQLVDSATGSQEIVEMRSRFPCGHA